MGQPNIVYIVLDDVGFSDLGCYGSEIKTPNMNRLAENGLRYNNFNATPLCSPTRASLLTGRNNHSVGMGSVADFDLGTDQSSIRGRILPKAATAAEILKDNGYSTMALGKWHLAPIHQLTPAGPFENWPLAKGFERYYGFLGPETDQFYPELTYDNHMVDPPEKSDYHFSEDIVDKSIQFVTDQVSVTPDKPYFLYLSFGAQHAPHQAPKEYIDMYKGAYDDGWDVIREKRLKRQKELGIVPEDTELSPRNKNVKAWDELIEDEKKVFSRFQEVYAGFLTHTDDQIGRFLDFLEKIGELDNTLIVFLSDNGASQEGGFGGSVNQSTFFNALEESIEDQLAKIDEMGGPRAGTNYPKGWAQAGNTPFKQYKQTTHFGGTRVPCIIHWPEGIQEKGAIRTQFHHVIDVTPTVLDILQVEAPKTYRGVDQMPIHGTSMTYTFENERAPTRRTTQYFEMFGHRAIYHEGWKAVTHHQKGVPFENDVWELYYVEEDFAELHDLADKYSGKLEELKELWWEEAKKYNVLPLNDKTVELSSFVSPEAVTARKTFTYYPGVAHLGTFAAPQITNKSYIITVLAERPSPSCEGVLVAHGDHDSGYVFYIRNNRLVFEYNYVGTMFKIESDVYVPIGECTFEFKFTKKEENSGMGSLYINGGKAGEGHIPKTLLYRLSHGGFDIGRDSLSQVSESYRDEGEFSFNGNIERVVYTLQDGKEIGNLDEKVKAGSFD
ncbi:arylsulfatase [Alteribacillus persepolensis]|uniref:Arylsulfatase n=1 Tax=Alteribacillus persepolensis TaxID=568899 RepID=A0A1G8J967_9BACI|nr:arylsulfatase [Alteribacillus persepolensis]SDI27190.1 arylsulfatase [Alteribacillus persepolensis]